jgi:lipopolysaccharide export system protein LptA
MKFHRILSFILLLMAFSAFGQRRVQLKQADILRGGVRGEDRYDWVIGNVIFVQNNVTIFCDSAIFYKKKDVINAFGRVRITDGDSVTVTSRRLEYDGKIKVAKFLDKVVFTKLNTATLYTDLLDYDRSAGLATYINGGKLVDSINTLTSRKGYYNANNNLASFKKNVHVRNPDYNMYSDSLQYNSRTKLIYFRTKTHVIDKDKNDFVYEGGDYDTKTRRSVLTQGVAETPSYRLKGSHYILDDIAQVYKLRENVEMEAKDDSLTIYGSAMDYDKKTGIAKVFSDAYLAKVVGIGDTLFLSADTLVSIDNDDPAKKRLLAYPNVKIYKSDIQGRADSIEYRPADSTFILYRNPILWTEGNQMTADTISMLIHRGTIDKIFLQVNAFVVSQDTLKDFNQIKGRRMVASLAGRQINNVSVDGNGESIYYALDEKDNSFRGLNKIACSNILIRFKEGRINNLTFYVKPDASFIPPHELKAENTRLTGFQWLEELKPTRKAVLENSARGQKEP